MDNNYISIQIEKNYEKGKTNKNYFEDILSLFEEAGKGTDEVEEKIRDILQHRKNLFTHQYYDKKNRSISLLRYAKFVIKASYERKQKIVDTIVDVGYESFSLSENSCSGISLALFFAAAKGDPNRLKAIIEYFKQTGQTTKLHDTHEGDTLLLFIIKFGTHSSEGLLECLELILNEKVDSSRVDYYKNNVHKVIENEIYFIKDRCDNYPYVEKLERIREILNDYAKTDDTYVQDKHKVFEALIMDEKETFSKLLNPETVNHDDGENTLIQLAIIRNNLEVVQVLLRNGVNPNLIVEGRNKEPPVLLAAKLSRHDIVKELLNCKHVSITAEIFAKFFTEIKKFKLLNYLLESKSIDFNIEYKGNIPLHYAIKLRNKQAIQLLLKRGSRITDSCLQFISPNDLEDYFNTCIKFDNYITDLEEGKYNIFLLFDVFIHSSKRHTKNENEVKQNSNVQPDPDKTTLLIENNEVSSEEYDPEISMIRKIGNSKRHKHLLEHPLIYIYIFLKWATVRKYYYGFLVIKLFFYMLIAIFIYTGSFYKIIVIPVLAGVVCYNYWQTKCNFKEVSLHLILDFLLLFSLLALSILQFVDDKRFVDDKDDIIKQISAFAIVFSSISIIITIGYHIKLSKWMAMVKRVFSNFARLLIFFMIPIVAFATAFHLLLSRQDGTKKPPIEEEDNADFSNLSRAIFRTIIMLAGDIGDKRFTTIGGYILFLLFATTMGILLLNFWVGVAVSDIKEIEEQSVVVAFQNVMVFIESVEQSFNSIRWVVKLLKLPPPFLKSQIELKNRRKVYYGVKLFINSKEQFKQDIFKNCRIPSSVIAKIKSLAPDDRRDTR